MVKRGRKGQITVFIIIGILILGVVLGTVYLSKYLTKGKLEEEAVSVEVAPVKMFVEDCLKKTVEDAVDVIARQGGYLILPEKSTENAIINTAYYFYLKTGLMPTEEIVKSELETYIDSELQFCLRNFADFKGYSFEVGKPQSIVSFNENMVSVNLDFPLTIIKENMKTEISKFEVRVPVRLGTLYNIAKELTDIQVEFPGQVCISCIANLADENHINISVVEFENDTLLFILTDEEILINGKALHYRYANKYSPPNASTE